MAIINWNKLYTETLFDTLKRFRNENIEFSNEKVTYAGRLDPMAEGILLLLTGNDVYQKEDFLRLDKVYEVDFIFGPETDTGDILGVLTSNTIGFKMVNEDSLNRSLQLNTGKRKQLYPSFSSKPVDGKSMFEWARAGKLDEITIPEKDIEIYNIKYLGYKKASKDVFTKMVTTSINKVNGDFRQDDILKGWYDYFFNTNNSDVFIYSIRVSASSGTYMRSLVKNIGETMGIPACSLKINRTRIGSYSKQ